MLKVLYLIGALSALVIADSHGQSSDETNPVVHAPSGTVRGSLMKSRLGRTIYSFRAIRYAKPPVGDLRFKPPVEHRWEGTFDASQDGPLCPQPGFNITTEDCLRINVYSPKLPQGRRPSKYPVIVFLHDGAFTVFGGVSLFRGPEYFLDHDVVLVTFNYRIGALGFLSTGTAEAPGNYGMKDQIHALKWIQKNIGAFGGDKSSVTLLGYSAGGWSITLHCVSPIARGLFHRGIFMSGTALGLYPLRDNLLAIAKRQARIVGCPSDTPANIVSCLKTKSAEELGNSLSGFEDIGGGASFSYAPVIEKDFGQERYLTDQPIKLIEEKNFYQVPLIGGRNKDEFAFAAYYLLTNETAVKLLNENFEKYAPIMFLYEQNTPKSRRVTRAVKRFYLKDQPISNETVTGLAKVFADAVVGYGTYRAVELYAKNSNKPVYYYLTTYLGRISDFYLPGSNGTIPYGVVHQDELIYLFHNGLSRPIFDDVNFAIEARATAKITTLYANFATYGDPTPVNDTLLNGVRWEPYNHRTQKYLDFGDTLQMKDRMFRRRYDFWEDLYPLTEYP